MAALAAGTRAAILLPKSLTRLLCDLDGSTGCAGADSLAPLLLANNQELPVPARMTAAELDAANRPSPVDKHAKAIS